MLIHEPEDVLTAQRRAFRSFSPFHRAWQELPMRDVVPAPESIASADDLHSDVHGLDKLRAVQPTAAPEHLLEPGEPAARERLARWIEAKPGHGPAAYATGTGFAVNASAVMRPRSLLRTAVMPSWLALNPQPVAITVIRISSSSVASTAAPKMMLASG